MWFQMIQTNLFIYTSFSPNLIEIQTHLINYRSKKYSLKIRKSQFLL
jgi:hypothetical protein